MAVSSGRGNLVSQSVAVCRHGPFYISSEPFTLWLYNHLTIALAVGRTREQHTHNRHNRNVYRGFRLRAPRRAGASQVSLELVETSPGEATLVMTSEDLCQGIAGIVGVQRVGAGNDEIRLMFLQGPASSFLGCPDHDEELLGSLVDLLTASPKTTVNGGRLCFDFASGSEGVCFEKD